MNNVTFEIDFSMVVYSVVRELNAAHDLSSFETIVTIAARRIYDVVCVETGDEYTRLRAKCAEVLAAEIDRGTYYPVRLGYAYDDGGAAAEEECHP